MTEAYIVDDLILFLSNIESKSGRTRNDNNLMTWMARGTETSEEYLPNRKTGNDRNEIPSLERPVRKF